MSVQKHTRDDFIAQMKKQHDVFDRSAHPEGSPNIHFDWWMFPLTVEQALSTSHPEWSLTLEEMQSASKDEEFIAMWLKGVKRVCSSYNYDLESRTLFPNSQTKWYNWPVRLYKMITSSVNLQQWDVYNSLLHFSQTYLTAQQRTSEYSQNLDFLSFFKPVTI
jgi:hypothetical protein